MINKFKTFLLFLFGFATVFSNAQTFYETPENPLLKEQKLKGAFSFILIGDWGRNGEFHQKPVSNQMAIASKTLGADIVVSVGDNFYPDGVMSTQDPQWKYSFEDIYPQYDLNKPWLVALGNHDYYGNYEAQIEYSKISRRWVMPSTYFSKTYKMKDGKSEILFLIIDTNPFVSKYSNYKGMISENVKKQDTAAQLAWLENQLKNKSENVKWVFVVGHHPLYSGGVRKTAEETEDIKKVFEPIFQKYKVDAYFCGHEHDLQIIQPKGIFTTQYLSGAGSAIRPSGEREGTKFAVSDGGFMIFSVTDKMLKSQTINGEGKILFTYEQKKN
ncbi:MAG: metallophosphoesterase [Cruoricaptor ignavus]|nr:metallophosphoesterase [Cruoricaptor ignavus]